MKDLIKPGLFLFANFLLIFTAGCGKTAVNHTNLPEGIETTSFDDWNACRHLADPVLSTLGLP